MLNFSIFVSSNIWVNVHLLLLVSLHLLCSQQEHLKKDMWQRRVRGHMDHRDRSEDTWLLFSPALSVSSPSLSAPSSSFSPPPASGSKAWRTTLRHRSEVNKKKDSVVKGLSASSQAAGQKGKNRQKNRRNTGWEKDQARVRGHTRVRVRGQSQGSRFRKGNTRWHHPEWR